MVYRDRTDISHLGVLHCEARALTTGAEIEIRDSRRKGGHESRSCGPHCRDRGLKDEDHQMDCRRPTDNGCRGVLHREIRALNAATKRPVLLKGNELINLHVVVSSGGVVLSCDNELDRVLA